MCYTCVTFSYIGVMLMKKILTLCVLLFLALAISCGNSVKKGEMLIYFSENGKKIAIEPVRIQTEIKARSAKDLSEDQQWAILAAFFSAVNQSKSHLGDNYTLVNDAVYSDEACTKSLSEDEFAALLIDKGVIAYFNCEKKEN